MNILITGVAGFLGFHLAQSLLSEGHVVIGVDNYTSGQKSNIQELCLFQKFKFFEEDVINLTLDKFTKEHLSSLKHIDQIFHMACPASPPIYQLNPLNTLDTCYLGSKNVFEIAKFYNARILIASTSEIYGDPLVHPQPESYRGNTNTFGPRACYDEGKRVMETLGFAYAQLGVKVRIARIFNTYGPRMSPSDGRVLTNFISQAIKGQSITIYGDGKQTRSFCFVSDLIQGLRLLINSEVQIPINLGSQFEYSILEVAQQVRDLINPKLEIVFHPLPTDDPKQRRPDTKKAKELIGWSAQVSLEDGVKKMYESFLN